MQEPSWIDHAIWWRCYPLGLTGVVPEPASGPVGPEEHRLRRLLGWLDHIVELGASGIALGPVFASSGHGYDTVDHLRLDPRLGDQADFDELVDQAHQRGLRIQLDGVFNHVGRDHPLARAALDQGVDSAAAELFCVRDGQFVHFEGHDQLLTLNHDDPRVVEYVVQIMTHWLDKGADAWRLDAAYAVPPAFWAQVLPRVRAAHPQVWFEAEVIHGDYAEFVTSSTADTCTQYELWKAIWSSINDHNLHELAWTLGRNDELLDTFVPSTFIGNHDVTRIASRITQAEHLAHAVALLALLPGTPTIYAGDEFGLRAIKEERFGGDDAIRPEFGPDPSTVDGDPSVLELHQRLFGLRRRHPWLHRARAEFTDLAGDHGTITLHGTDGQRLALALNLSDQPVQGPDGSVLAKDDASAPGHLAAHGWQVVEPANQ